eukprot:gene10786-7243_t
MPHSLLAYKMKDGEHGIEGWDFSAPPQQRPVADGVPQHRPPAPPRPVSLKGPALPNATVFPPPTSSRAAGTGPHPRPGSGTDPRRNPLDLTDCGASPTRLRRSPPRRARTPPRVHDPPSIALWREGRLAHVVNELADGTECSFASNTGSAQAVSTGAEQTAMPSSKAVCSVT